MSNVHRTICHVAIRSEKTGHKGRIIEREYHHGIPSIGIWTAVRTMRNRETTFVSGSAWIMLHTNQDFKICHSKHVPWAAEHLRDWSGRI